MLQGTRISLRQIRESDLDALYDAHSDIRNRGEFFPLGVMSEPAFRKTFAEGGLWQDVLLFSLLRDDRRPWRAPPERGGDQPEAT